MRRYGEIWGEQRQARARAASGGGRGRSGRPARKGRRKRRRSRCARATSSSVTTRRSALQTARRPEPALWQRPPLRRPSPARRPPRPQGPRSTRRQAAARLRAGPCRGLPPRDLPCRDLPCRRRQRRRRQRRRRQRRRRQRCRARRRQRCRGATRRRRRLRRRLPPRRLLCRPHSRPRPPRRPHGCSSRPRSPPHNGRRCRLPYSAWRPSWPTPGSRSPSGRAGPSFARRSRPARSQGPRASPCRGGQCQLHGPSPPPPRPAATLRLRQGWHKCVSVRRRCRHGSTRCADGRLGLDSRLGLERGDPSVSLSADRRSRWRPLSHACLRCAPPGRAIQVERVSPSKLKVRTSSDTLMRAPVVR